MDVLITKLKNAENEEYPQLVQDTLKDLSAKAASSPDSGAFSVTAPNSIEAILKSSEADDILKYEDIFLLEHEKTFNAEKVNEYTTKQAEVTYIAIKNNQLTVLQKKSYGAVRGL